MLLTETEWQIVSLSLRVATLSIIVSLPAGVAVAYLLARRRMPLPFLVENLVQLPLVLPPVVTGYLLLMLFGPRGPIGGWLESAGLEVAFTWIGAVVAAGVVSFPLLVQPMRVTFEQLDPEWEEAVRIYGGGRWAVFRMVMLPLSARGIAAGIALAFARALGEFGATIVVAGNIAGQTRTIPLAIFTRINQVGGETGALRLLIVAVILSVLSLTAHAVLSRRFHNPARR